MEYAYPTGGYTTAYTVTSSTPSYVGENEYSWVVPSNVHAASIYMATVVLDRQWPENHMYLDRSDQRFTMTRPEKPESSTEWTSVPKYGTLFLCGVSHNLSGGYLRGRQRQREGHPIEDWYKIFQTNRGRFE